MSQPKPPCVTLPQWLRDNLGKRALAPLTGTDYRALLAAVMIVEAWSYDRCEENVQAFALIASRMQPQCRYFAFHAIAHVVEWSDRWLLWRQAALDEVDVVGKPRCAWEPGGSKRP